MHDTLSDTSYVLFINLLTSRINILYFDFRPKVKLNESLYWKQIIFLSAYRETAVNKLTSNLFSIFVIQFKKIIFYEFVKIQYMSKNKE